MNQLLTLIREYQKKSGKRKKDRVFVVEGIRACRELPPERRLKTVVSESYAKDFGLPEGAVVVPDRDFERISDTRTPQGILMTARMMNYTEEELLKETDGLYLLLEDLQDPGNLGTIIRSAEAAGVTGIFMSENCVDVYNPKVIRATMGSVFRVKFTVVGDLKDTIRKIQKSGGAVYAAHLDDSVDYDAADYTKKTAFLIGNEGNGLKRETADSADRYIKIPMEGQVESLNAAIAATVLVFEAFRQRRKG